MLPYTDYQIEDGTLTAVDPMVSMRVEIGSIATIMCDYFAWHREKYGALAPGDQTLYDGCREEDSHG